MIERGYFAYPWTIDEANAEGCVERYAEQFGANSLYVGCSYHSGRFFQPSSANRVWTRHRSGLSFIPNLKLYPDELKPTVDEGAQHGQHARIREACDKHGVAYHSWAVGLHNSTLGREHPEWTVMNTYGNRYDYALCPSQPSVRRYLIGLVQDIATSLQPKSILLETPGFLGFVHGHHHELVLSQLGPVGEYLLSLCFCSACKARAETEGIDTDELHRTVLSKVEYLTERERGSIPTDFTNGEMASLLLEEPELYAYTAMRIRSVTELVRELYKVVSGYGIRLLAVPSVFVRPGSKAWMEGTGLKQLDEFIDGFMLLSYFPNARLVKADIEWLRMFASRSELYSAFNAGGSDAPDEATLAACAKAATSHDTKGVYFYNASLLTETRLRWTGNIMRTLEG
ncbi:hypothetical protein ACF3MZ_20705 [Paenibacillaceae bacterium WGS1546]|uniref:hypothetical protein n=1 Tax=Cohnella sp. WGS1546 TaxID=3366810 RepID=UPI00372D8158